MTEDSSSTEGARAWRIGEYVLHPGTGQLQRGDVRVVLSPRSQYVLLALLQHPGDVVGNEDLLAAMPDAEKATVNAVQKCVTELRAAFGDSRTDARYIQTVTKHGYRLLATVEILQPDATPDATAHTHAELIAAAPESITSTTHSRRATAPWVVAIAAGSIFVVAALALWHARAGSESRTDAASAQAAGPGPNIYGAVAAATSITFPQINCQPDSPAMQLMCARLQRLVLGGIARMDHVSVVAVPDPRAPEHDRSLKPAYVLDTAVQQADEQIQVTASLYESASHSQIYAYSGGLPLAESERLLPRHAAAILSALEVYLNQGLLKEMRSLGTRNVEAYRALASGLYMRFPIGLPSSQRHPATPTGPRNWTLDSRRHTRPCSTQ